MKNPDATGTMAEQTARDLLGLVFDEGGLAVPGDDLAPAAMAGYRRYRRWRRAAAGAGASAVMAGVVATAFFVGGGDGSGGPRMSPGVWSRTDAPGSSPSGPSASSSAPGSGASRVVDCFSNFEAPGSAQQLPRAQADCRRAEALWQAVFPSSAVSGARDPSSAQVTGGFLARVRVQGASDPSLYGRAQPRVVADWNEARQEDANAGVQSWSGFDIATGAGTITVSAEFHAGKNGDLRQPCGGATPCQDLQLSDGRTAEVSGSGDVHGYQVTVRSPSGEAYRIFIGTRYDPRYVAVPCSSAGGYCYADLSDGSIRPGLTPSTEATLGSPAVTDTSLAQILHEPAFAALVNAYFAEGLGQSAASS